MPSKPDSRFRVERLNRVEETQLAPLMDASWRHWQSLGYSDDPSPAHWRDYLRAEDRAQPRLHFVVLHDNQAVAMATVTDLDFPAIPAYKPWLTNLFVLPAYRNKGLAGLLRAHRLAALRQLGYTSVHVLAAPGTRGLHERAGFAMLDEELNVMQKAL